MRINEETVVGGWTRRVIIGADILIFGSKR